MFHWAQVLRRAVQSKHRADGRQASRRSQERAEVAAFCGKVVVPALQELQQEWERLGRRVSVCRDATIFHITVWHDRMVEFHYTIAACRRKRRFRRYGYVHPEATTYQVEAQRVYALSEIRRTGRHTFAKQIAEQYRQSMLTR